jgi:hypothetical protein
VTVFNAGNIFADTATDSLQVLAVIPGLPAWLTPVGQGYRYVANSELDRNIAFNYLPRDVPEGYEYGIELYYSGDEGKMWVPLKAQVNSADNLAVARMGGSGFYVLATSVDVPLTGNRWQLVAYPIPEKRPVAQALESILPSQPGDYTTVYGYDSHNQDNPWRVYDTASPSWANDLKELEFGRGYWVAVSRPVTLQLGIPSTPIRDAPVPDSLGQLSQLTPPATYYGDVTGAAGDEVEAAGLVAAIDGAECGQGKFTRDASGRLHFTIKVAAADESAAGCGAPGRQIEFRTSGDRVLGTQMWDNKRPEKIELQWP